MIQHVYERASAVLNKVDGFSTFCEVSDLILSVQGKADVYSTAEDFSTAMSGAVQ